MYVGIGPEKRKRVTDEDAFMYAMEHVTTVEQDMQDFVENFSGIHYENTPEGLKQFRIDLVEWFYSGNWVWEADFKCG